MENREIVELAKMQIEATEAADIDPIEQFGRELDQLTGLDHVLLALAVSLLSGRRRYISSANPETISRSLDMAGEMGALVVGGDLRRGMGTLLFEPAAH